MDPKVLIGKETQFLTKIIRREIEISEAEKQHEVTHPPEIIR